MSSGQKQFFWAALQSATASIGVYGILTQPQKLVWTCLLMLILSTAVGFRGFFDEKKV